MGRLIYDIAKMKCDISLPSFSIDANNFTDTNLEIRNSNIEDILSIIATSNIYEMVGKLEGNADLGRAFELNCMFKKIIVCNKTFFVIENQVPKSLRGNLLEVMELKERHILYIFCK